MPPHVAINFTHVDCDFNKCRGGAETAGHRHSWPCLDEEDRELNSEDDYKVIKKEDKEVSSHEKPLSPIPEERFKKYKAPSTHVNPTDAYNNLRNVPSQTFLPFRFSTRSPITMRNELLDHIFSLLEGTEKPILIANSDKPLSNEEPATIVRYATKNVDSQLYTIDANFQQHSRQHWTDCCYYYCNPMAAVTR